MSYTPTWRNETLMGNRRPEAAGGEEVLAAYEKDDELPFSEWGEEQTMKPLTERHQHANEDKCSPLPSTKLQRHFKSESVVVVLGVMYPRVLPQLVEADTHLDLVPLPPGLVTGRQSADVVFYDPLSSSKNGKVVPQAAKYRKNSKGDGHANRTERQKAVARDLALLSLGET